MIRMYRRESRLSTVNKWRGLKYQMSSGHYFNIIPDECLAKNS